jgi:hypothetical protein
MAGTAAGRHDASSLWPGEDLALVGCSHTHNVRGCGCMLRNTCTKTGGECAWVRCAHGGQRQSGSAARLR